MKKEKITAEELRKLLKGKLIILDCGHRFCLHLFSNTMIVHSNGETECHS